jgi:hypothetical protein
MRPAVDLRRAQFMFLEPERENRIDARLILIGDGRAPAFGKKFD